MELFFTANSIADDKKVAVFLSMIGGKTYSLLRDLIAPEKPQDKSQSVLLYEPKPLVIAERFYFHRRNQGANKTIADYIAELQRLATNCEFWQGPEQSFERSVSLRTTKHNGSY